MHEIKVFIPLLVESYYYRYGNGVLAFVPTRALSSVRLGGSELRPIGHVTAPEARTNINSSIGLRSLPEPESALAHYLESGLVARSSCCSAATISFKISSRFRVIPQPGKCDFSLCKSLM